MALSALLSLALPGQAATLYVSQSGDGSDGLSWPAAYTAIGAAIDAATAGDEIWVAGGIYNETIELIADISLYGGFMGNESPEEFGLRDWEGNPSIIDLTGIADRGVLGADDCVLDGFTVRNGTGDFAKYSGRGMACIGTTMMVQNCDFHNNDARYSECYRSTCVYYWYWYPCWLCNEGGTGGGIWLNGSSSVFINCKIFQNDSRFYGGGIESIP